MTGKKLSTKDDKEEQRKGRTTNGKHKTVKETIKRIKEGQNKFKNKTKQKERNKEQRKKKERN